MRIYSNPYELMSETARNLYEMGNEVKPVPIRIKLSKVKMTSLPKNLYASNTV